MYAFGTIDPASMGMLRVSRMESIHTAQNGADSNASLGGHSCDGRCGSWSAVDDATGA